MFGKNYSNRIFYVLIYLIEIIIAQHEDVPYANVENICATCTCLTTNDHNPNKFHHILDCNNKGLEHILAEWPNEFGANHKERTIQVTFSENQIPLLQQLPPSIGMISFSCRHCQIQEIQTPTFVDCPNIYRLDLSWNLLTSDSLTPDIFRGPYNETAYEPIGLQELDLSHNLINALDLKIFEHIQGLRILNLSGNQFEHIDIGTMDAIQSANNLEVIDLSWNKLLNLPDELFVHLPKIQTIFIQGNQFENIPHAIKKIAGSLHALDISSNYMKTLNMSSFNNLVHLKFLNISDMHSLTTIAAGTFSTLIKLEELYAYKNEHLITMHLPNASPNLKKLDISWNNLKKVILNPNLIHLELNETSNVSWPKLQIIQINNNPWNCDCNFLNIFKQYFPLLTAGNTNDEKIRCSSPYQFSGTLITELNRDEFCKEQERKLVIPPPSSLPSFLRPRFLKITVFLLAFAIVAGTIVGFAIVCVKKKLRKDLYMINTNQIRYTTVTNVPI